MLGHVSLGVRDLQRAARFYDAMLSALGYVRLWTGDGGLVTARQGKVRS